MHLRVHRKVCIEVGVGKYLVHEGSHLNGIIVVDLHDAGIRLMHSFYLREVYASKEEQERIVHSRNLTSLILRPRVLSFSNIPLNPDSVPRSGLATRILNWCSMDRDP